MGLVFASLKNKDLILAFYTLQLQKMDELKTTLQIDEQNSNEDLDFFDAMDDMNTYLDSVDDFDDIDALAEWYLTFWF